MVSTSQQHRSAADPGLRDLAGPAAVLQAALAAPDRDRPYRQMGRNMAILARQAGALGLRRAMLMAWFFEQDLTEIGYSSFAAFVTERVDWSISHERAMRRLFNSPLDKVKAAVCQGLIPVRLAVNAPGEVPVDGQEQWLADQVRASAEQEAHERRVLHPVSGDEAMVVRKARRLARLYLGRHASERQIDEQIMAWYADQVSPDELLELAHAPREAPPRGALSWGWCEDGAPAEALLGPWSEPASLAEALDRLDVLQGILRARDAILAHAWAIFCLHYGWLACGYDSKQAFAEQVLGWSSSTAGRYHRRGWQLEWRPAIRAAVQRWLHLSRVEALRPALGDYNDRDERWLNVLKRIGRRELDRAMRTVKAGTSPVPTLRDYEEAIAKADRWDAARRAGAGGGDPSVGGDGAGGSDPSVGGDGASGSEPSVGGDGAGRGDPSVGGHSVGGGDSSVGGDPSGGDPSVGGDSSVGGGPPHDASTSAVQPLRVALPQPEPTPRQLRRELRVQAGLVEASRWLVEHVQIPKQRGFGKVKERDRFRCQNPECGRVGLRCHAHHEVPRSEGGSDDLDNGITLCRVCHLRLVHARTACGRPRLTVTSVMVEGLRALLWQWADGRRVLQFREWPGR